MAGSIMFSLEWKKKVKQKENYENHNWTIKEINLIGFEWNVENKSIKFDNIEAN